jgi:hypothetical protein
LRDAAIPLGEGFDFEPEAASRFTENDLDPPSLIELPGGGGRNGRGGDEGVFTAWESLAGDPNGRIAAEYREDEKIEEEEEPMDESFSQPGCQFYHGAIEGYHVTGGSGLYGGGSNEIEMVGFWEKNIL